VRNLAAVATSALIGALAVACFGSSSPTSSGTATTKTATSVTVTLHLGSGRRNVGTPVVYHFGQAFTITTTKPAATRLSGYFDAGGSHLANIGCPSQPQTTCHAGPFEGLGRGTVPRIWHLHVAKQSTPPATIRIIIRFG
jgi:hypothetical protein